MKPIALKELEWIHDCVLLRTNFNALSDAGRMFEITVRCPSDLGYEPWEGQVLKLLAADVMYLSHIVQNVGGLEIIDAVRPGFPKGAAEYGNKVERMEETPRTEKFTICFQSGSEIKIACREIQIEIENVNPP